MTAIPFFIIDDFPPDHENHLGLAVGLDDKHQHILIAQDRASVEPDETALVVLSVAEMERLLGVLQHHLTEEGEIKTEAYSVQ